MTVTAPLALFAQAKGNREFDPNIIWFVLAAVAGLVFIIFLFIFFSFIRLWIQSLLTGANISIFNLVGMKLRKVNYEMIVLQKIALVQAGVKVDTEDLESHFLARGNVPRTAAAVIAAHKAGLDLPWKRAAAIDLAGRDVLEAVRTSVNPKVIDCPDPTKGKQFLDAVCKNGIQLLAKARVTVRTKLERLVGGATEETIIARVGEGIVKAIGSAHDHREVLANPGLISQTVLHSGLDAQTAFEIVSIDIANLEPGENIGAKLAADQAASDLRVAQAEAEKRRAAAVALEQEMQAAIQENRAKVVLAEAEVPMAIAEAFKTGRLGVMDYYNLRNLQADTSMRNNIAGVSGGADNGPSR
ncbi:MAG: flotillin-like protein FloA [Gemmataceae bacterium]